MRITTLIASTVITILPLGFLVPEVGIKCGGNIGWLYFPTLNKIYVCEVDDNTKFYRDHELGHHFWYKFMDQAQKDKYKILFDKALKEWTGSFHREYGMTNIEEDFAENFALMVSKKNSPPKIQVRVRYIKKIFEQE